MANRDELKIPAKDEPTFWNKDAAVGFFVGGMIPVVGHIGGLIVGGLIGKNRMERESREGRITPEPTLWNKDMALGAGIGVFLMSAGALAGLLTAGIGGLLMGAIGTVVAGALIGGAYGKNRMKEEYQDALNIRARGELQSQAEPAQGVLINAPGYTRSVSPQEVQVLDARMKQAQGGIPQFAEQIEQARSQPKPAVPQV